MGIVETINLPRLSIQQHVQFKEVLKEAAKNVFLGGDEEEVIPLKTCTVILFGHEKRVVGFYTPKNQSLNGVLYWRAGTLFLLEEYRGKGVMFSVLQTFFATHQPGLVWIEDTNKASIALFTKLGFVKAKAKNDGQHRGHWYVKEKIVPIYINW